MSSAAIVEIGCTAAVAAGLLLANALGGSATVTGTALSGLGDAVAAAADRMGRTHQAREDAERRYVQLALGVLDRHARISAVAEALAAARRDLGVQISAGLPERLRYEGQDATTLAAWCADADRALDRAEGELSVVIARAITTRVARLASPPGASLPGVAAAQDEAAAGDSEGAERAATLERVLSRLAPDATTTDRDAVMAAARAAAAARPEEAESMLTDVRVRIQQANTAARRRRDSALTAARLRYGLAGLPGPDADTARTRLADVIAGRAALDGELEAQARELSVLAASAREREYVAAQVAESLTGLGYEVSEGFETLASRGAEGRVTQPGWPEHAVKLKVDQAGELRFAMVRTAAAGPADDEKADAEREKAWCASFEQARASLANRGIVTTVTWRLDPGTHRLPVSAGPAARTAGPGSSREGQSREGQPPAARYRERGQ